jgi:LmbE family N-acetylglucosaminyl deacetylase
MKLLKNMAATKVLIIVPHGDDEVLSCGGAINRYIREGHEVHVAFIRDACDRRTLTQLNATKRAMDVLKYQHIHFLRQSEQCMQDNFIKFKGTIEKLIAKVQPQIIITTFEGDNHQDHRSTFRAVSVATRHHNAPFVKLILAGEINSSTEQAIGANPFVPNYYISLTEEDIDTKILAMQAYDTEARVAPHGRSSECLRATATVRGMRIGKKYAEAFMCFKQIY